MYQRETQKETRTKKSKNYKIKENKYKNKRK